MRTPAAPTSPLLARLTDAMRARSAAYSVAVNLRIAAQRDGRTDAELQAVATWGVPGDLCNDQAHVALALLRARQGKLDEMHPAHVARAVAVLKR